MRAPKTFRRFGADKSGLAALEFAILLPMMVILLFGSVEVINMLSTNQRVQNVAASLADVIARDTEVSNAEINGLWIAMDTLMFPEPPAPLEARITSILIVNATTAQVTWSDGNGMPARAVNSTVTLPTAMMQVGSSIIMAETSYRYTSIIGVVTPDELTITHTSYRRTRLVEPIPRVS
jgi:Flp pilus assembly protein TadG